MILSERWWWIRRMRNVGQQWWIIHAVILKLCYCNDSTIGWLINDLEVLFHSSHSEVTPQHPLAAKGPASGGVCCCCCILSFWFMRGLYYQLELVIWCDLLSYIAVLLYFIYRSLQQSRNVHSDLITYCYLFKVVNVILMFSIEWFNCGVIKLQPS